MLLTTHELRNMCHNLRMEPTPWMTVRQWSRDGSSVVTIISGHPGEWDVWLSDDYSLKELFAEGLPPCARCKHRGTYTRLDGAMEAAQRAAVNLLWEWDEWTGKVAADPNGKHPAPATCEPEAPEQAA